MKIVEAKIFFESLKNNTDKKSELKIYESFIGILSDLKNKKLTTEQLQSNEEELDILDFKADVKNREKYYAQKLERFKKYLRVNLSIVSQGYYSTLSISLGIAFGAAFGVVFDESIGITYGVSLGLVLGIIIGKLLDLNAEKKNRVLKIKKKK